VVAGLIIALIGLFTIPKTSRIRFNIQSEALPGSLETTIRHRRWLSLPGLLQ